LLLEMENPCYLSLIPVSRTLDNKNSGTIHT
jgi:hypothetical protein